MNNQIEIRLSGTGGQGLITSGIILAEAAVRYGKNAIQTQSYGPEARGGASKAEVIISDSEIYYPKVLEADVLLVMSEEAYVRYKNTIKKDGILIIDSSLIKEEPEVKAKIFKIPITEIAQEKLGKKITSNIVALGALTAITQVIPKEFVEEVVFKRFPKAKEINQKAFNIGFDYGRR